MKYYLIEFMTVVGVIVDTFAAYGAVLSMLWNPLTRGRLVASCRRLRWYSIWYLTWRVCWYSTWYLTGIVCWYMSWRLYRGLMWQLVRWNGCIDGWVVSRELGWFDGCLNGCVVNKSMIEHWDFYSVAILASMRAASKDHSVAVKKVCSLKCSMALWLRWRIPR